MSAVEVVESEETEKAIIDHGCDSLTTGLTWCEHLGECIDATAIPCTDGSEFPNQDCADGMVFCYCTGDCQDPSTSECTDPITGGQTYDLDGRIQEDCWAVQPYMQEIDTTLMAAALSAR